MCLFLYTCPLTWTANQSDFSLSDELPLILHAESAKTPLRSVEQFRCFCSHQTDQRHWHSLMGLTSPAPWLSAKCAGDLWHHWPPSTCCPDNMYMSLIDATSTRGAFKKKQQQTNPTSSRPSNKHIITVKCSAELHQVHSERGGGWFSKFYSNALMHLCHPTFYTIVVDHIAVMQRIK